MNLLKILSKVGGAILTDLIPGGKEIVNVVNGFLPDEKKLPTTATGSDIQTVISTLPPNQKSTLLEKQFDVELAEIEAHTNVTIALGDVDKTGSSTRPFVALLMAWVVAFAIVVLISMLAFAIKQSDSETIKAVGDSWPLVTAMLAIPSALLRAYFGMRTKEKQQKYQAVSNQQTPASGLTSLLKIWKG
ncbi:MAG: hypothetical protein HRT38_02795 [Alteromonadaceae bacterium]|nr:hypothetical protein [Alteromonadaceae bacterium]